MSIHRRIFFGAAASWFSRGMTILMGLVLMPVLFRTLPKEELGLWLLIGQSAAVLGILDFGFGITFTRRIAFARGKSGSDPRAPLNEASCSEIADLITTGLRLYRVLALIAFLVSISLGFFYLRTLELESVPVVTVWNAWAILCLSNALTVWATPWTCLLQGVGHVGWDALVASFTGAITLLAQVVTALCGGGIVALAIVAAAGAVIQRTVILGVARRKQSDLFSLKGRWRSEWCREMMPYAWRAWLTALGTVLALNTDPFFVAKFEGTRELPAYRAAYVILVNLNMVAVSLASASSVFVTHLWTEGQKDRIRQILWRNLRAGLFLMAVGGAWLLAVGPVFFDFWLGPGNFVGYGLLVIFLLIQFGEAQGFISSSTARATHDESFGHMAITGGVLKLILSWLFLKPLGLPGIALGTLIGQLLTNYWYTVWRSFRRLEVSSRFYFLEVALPVSVVFASVFFACEAVIQSLSDRNGILILSVSGALAAIIFTISCWTLVLNRGQRMKIASKFPRASQL